MQEKFTKADLEFFQSKKIEESEIIRQINCLSAKRKYVILEKAAVVADGIKIITENDFERYSKIYRAGQRKGLFSKFVPASGAASRMFKVLLKFLEEARSYSQEEISQSSEKDFIFLNKFLINLDKFAFYDSLKEVMAKNGLSLTKSLQNYEYKVILNYLLSEKGLNYSFYPKAFLEFHKYGKETRTPYEEQIIEGLEYLLDERKNLKIHFTLSKEHLENKSIQDYLENLIIKYREKGIILNLSHSIQEAKTDTVALDLEKNLFRKENQQLLFRPGGHGALIYNLNKLEGDFVFIKNIDNVSVDAFKNDTYQYKKIIGGLALELKEQIDSFLRKIEEGFFDLILKKEMDDFILNNFQIDLSSFEKEREYFDFLNRPLRICGMVKNTGEPGGGPFWIKKDSRISLQIVESSEINLEDEQQNNLFQKSTHFNPVDLVVSLKNYKKEKFDLEKFIDNDAYFLAKKSYQGRELIALERPGLWNGAMAHWLTVFVEVPIATFNPVKTVNDLLKAEHSNSRTSSQD